MATLLKISHVKKYYGKKDNITKALNDISIEINKKDFISIMGASGSGKTSLLNCISMIDKVTSGNIYLNEIDITKLKKNNISIYRRKQLGFIFQDFNLFDTLTAYENIALSLSINKIKEIDSKIIDIAIKLGISDILKKYPYQLSGGQKQRVAAARAIVVKPSLILADEPTGALDSKSSNDFLKLLKDINDKYGTTIIMVTHDAKAASYSNRVIFIRDGNVYYDLLRKEQSSEIFYKQISSINEKLGDIDAI